VIFDITTKIVFAVNQLTPSSIGISPLTKIHPKLLLQLQVRSINQILASSLGFGSNLVDFNWPLNLLADPLCNRYRYHYL
jgi:hypothetical protein